MLGLALLTILGAGQATSAAPTIPVQDSGPAIQQTLDRNKATPQEPWPPLGVYREKDAGVTAPRVQTRPDRLQMTTRQYQDAHKDSPKIIQEKMVLEVVVLPDGTAGEVRIKRPLGPDEFGMNEHAVRNVKNWKFVAGTKDGRSVPVLMEITLEVLWAYGRTRDLQSAREISTAGATASVRLIGSIRRASQPHAAPSYSVPRAGGGRPAIPERLRNWRID